MDAGMLLAAVTSPLERTCRSRTMLVPSFKILFSWEASFDVDHRIVVTTLAR
jgi:hypothetical protein